MDNPRFETMRTKRENVHGRASDLSYLRIVFPRKIPDLNIPLDFDAELNCEDVIWQCIDYLKKSEFVVTEGQDDISNEGVDEHIGMLEIIHAFGLMKEENQLSWLPLNHVFKSTTSKLEVYKFCIRHRPPANKLCERGSFFYEYFVLQALDDLLLGCLGKSKEVPLKILMQLTSMALLFPDSLPLKNLYEIDRSHKVKGFHWWNYHKLFSKDLYKQLIPDKYLDRFIDHISYYSEFKNTFDKYKEVNKNAKLVDYKDAFLSILIENYPWYCFGKFPVKIPTDSGGGYRETTCFLNLYREPKDQDTGIYLDEKRHCGLEDIGNLDLMKIFVGNEAMWQVELKSNYSPMYLNQVMLFESEGLAASFISMLQGYMTLCIKPNIILCEKLSSASVIEREKLKSFCPLSQSEAVEYLENANLQIQDKYKSGHIMYQSKTKPYTFHVAVSTQPNEPVCDIKSLNGKGFLLYPKQSSDSDHDRIEYGVDDLRNKLSQLYGPRLNAKNVAQHIDTKSLFYFENPLGSTDDVATDLLVNKTTSIVIDDDLMPYNFKEREDDGTYLSKETHLKRSVVEMKDSGDRRVLLKLIPEKMSYIESFHEGICVIAQLGRLHPMTLVEFYGQLIHPKIHPSFLFEHSEYGNLVEFMTTHGPGVNTQQRLEFAHQVVQILFVLTQPRQGSSTIFHGNLRASNFYIFCNGKSKFLKLGDVGLVHYYNSQEWKYNDARLPWLSPERRRNLKQVTVESEVFAAATTVAEIFHETDNFRKILGLRSDEELAKYFCDDTKTIPLPPPQRLENDALTQDVLDLYVEVWETLSQCWNPDPYLRPSPVDLKDTFLELHNKARAIPEETVLEFLKRKIVQKYKEPVKKLTSVSVCRKFLLQKRLNSYIEPNHFECGNKCGQGSFGIVYRGKLNKRDIVIKVARNDLMLKDFEKEINLAIQLKHPYIVECLYESDLNGKPCIIMEYMNFKSLKEFVGEKKSYMDSKGRTKINHVRLLLKLSKDITMGMAYLEEQGVVHCDLAPRNVLLHKIGSEITAKVADFGLAKVLDKGKDYYLSNMESNILPYFSYAPEYLTFELFGVPKYVINYTTPGDVWAYGTTLWEIFSKGKNLGAAAKECNIDISSYSIVSSLYRFYIDDGKRWPRESYVDLQIYNLMLDCWKMDASERPSFVDLQPKLDHLLESYQQEGELMLHGGD